MSDFAGIVRFDGAPIDDRDGARIAGGLLGAGRARMWRCDGAVLAERRGPPFYDNGSSSPPVQARDDILLLATARLDAPCAVATALGRSPGEAGDDRSLVVAACLRWGPAAAAERLYGDFAVAQWDAGARRLTLARDALGVRPLYYVERSWGILFATRLQLLLTLPDVPRDLDDAVIAHTLAIAVQDQERTPYRHIRRAPPGGVMTFERGRNTSRRYFTAETLAPVRFARDGDYVAATRERLDAAVACRIPAAGKIGTLLSGGFDSGGIAATAARLMGPRRLHAYTRVPAFAHPYGHGDERGHTARLVASYPMIDWRLIDDPAGLTAAFEPAADIGITCVPRTASFNTAWFDSVLNAMRGDGIDMFLDGKMGNYVLSWAGTPDLPGTIGGLGRLGAGTARSALRTALSIAYRSERARGARRWMLKRTQGALPWLRFSLVSPDFLTEIDYGTLAAERGHDIPFETQGSHIERRLRMLQAQRGRDFGGYLRRRGRLLEPQSPYMDRALVELTLGMPHAQYWHRGTSRWLARRVLADRVPAETLAQTVNGKQSADWYAVATHHHAAMRDAVEHLARSRLASRVLDVPRMRQLLDDWPADAHAARAHETLHGHALQRAIAMGAFLRWHEGGNA